MIKESIHLGFRNYEKLGFWFSIHKNPIFDLLIVEFVEDLIALISCSNSSNYAIKLKSKSKELKP